MSTILPGSTIGVLGGGQLGRMLTQAATRLGYRVRFFGPETDAPAAQAGAVQTKGEYKDLDAITEFAKQIDVLTFEFENVSAEAAKRISEIVPVRPAGEVLRISQNRLREKTFLSEHGFPVTPFAEATSIDHTLLKLREFGGAAVLKTAELGYDGKGQKIVKSSQEISAAFKELGNNQIVIEKLIALKSEVSVIVTRSLSGEISIFGPFGNTHSNHILDTTVYPAPVSEKVSLEAIEIAKGVAKAFELCGILCIEMFVDESDNLMINELAPRTHNSGHLTIDAFTTSQFEQQVRAICNLPLGEAKPHGAAAMVNLLGDLWSNGEPNWLALKNFPAAKLHLYGKTEARPGRKMGHLTVLADTPEAAAGIAQAARSSLLS